MSIDRIIDDPRWYVIHTKPKQEERAGDNLMAWNVEALVPRFRSRQNVPHSKESKYRIQPLFPRYIFAWFNACHLLQKVRYTRGISKVVTFGGEPAPIDDEVIATIKSRITNTGFVKMEEEGFKVGDRVTINHDTLGRLEGIFKEGVRDTDRVRILLSAINYQAHIEVNKALVRLATT